MPKEGIASAFCFGVGFGSILSVLQTLQLPLALVTPCDRGPRSVPWRQLSDRIFHACSRQMTGVVPTSPPEYGNDQSILREFDKKAEARATIE